MRETYNVRTHDMIQEAAKGVGVLAVSGGTLLVTSSSTTLIKEWLQIILIGCTIVFTVIQILSLIEKRRHSKHLRELLGAAHNKCDSARSGLCPVNDIYEKLLAKKD